MSTMVIVVVVGAIWLAFALLAYFMALGLLHAYVWLRRRWYRWHGHREFTQADRVSLNALARMERKP